jgi:ABC-2 type transport system ATP-binding protein
MGIDPNAGALSKAAAMAVDTGVTQAMQAEQAAQQMALAEQEAAKIAARQRLGYLPEGAPAYPDMTVGAFLEFGASMRGLDRATARRRLAELVERIDLEEVWNRRIEALSKGFKRRVGIAQALVHDPDVLILDEPTDGLDPNQKHEMRELIRALAPDKAIVVSTHILDEVEAICTRALIIARGRLLVDSTPAELLARAPKPDPSKQQLVRSTPLEDAFRHITLETAGA